MSLIDMFSESRISLDLKAASKEEVIDELIEILVKDDKVSDKEEFRKAVLKREKEFSTGIGMGIAIPHGKSKAVKEATIAFGRSNNGIDYKSMDEKPAHIFFLIAVPEESNDVHLKALAEISRKLMHTKVRENIMNAKSYEQFIESFQ